MLRLVRLYPNHGSHPAWMTHHDDLPQVFWTHPRVDLCGREAGVAEQFLDRPEVSPAFHHVGCS